jgi:hypothetical protein
LEKIERGKAPSLEKYIVRAVDAIGMSNLFSAFILCLMFFYLNCSAVGPVECTYARMT